MRIEVKSIIKAPIQNVWDFLLDPQKLASCVPGCENVLSLDENSYMVIEAVKVGPISAKFNLKVTIVEMTPPHHLRVTIEGKDAKTTSLVNTKVWINLEQSDNGEAHLNYTLDVALTGILGKFGGGILRKKADSLAEEFAVNIRSHLEYETR